MTTSCPRAERDTEPAPPETTTPDAITPERIIADREAADRDIARWLAGEDLFTSWGEA
jgi:hypothetical protein